VANVAGSPAYRPTQPVGSVKPIGFVRQKTTPVLIPSSAPDAGMTSKARIGVSKLDLDSCGRFGASAKAPRAGIARASRGVRQRADTEPCADRNTAGRCFNDSQAASGSDVCQTNRPSYSLVDIGREAIPSRRGAGCTHAGALGMRKPVLRPVERARPACHGTGVATVKQSTREGVRVYPPRCRECLGKGRIADRGRQLRRPQ
jgi:hypothetical protein